MPPSENFRTPPVIACIWDFDKTLIPNYMQQPLFDAYGVDGERFWKEVNKLPELYKKCGVRVSKDTVYLNHLLSYVKNGPMRGLSNKKLFELGKQLKFYPGLPKFFDTLRAIPQENELFARHEIQLEHYVVSTGLAELIKGSEIAEHVDDIYGCEFIEAPLPPHFSAQDELLLEGGEAEISQIGVMVDNTIKTRFIFEINKGVNKYPDIDVNATMREEDRRVPIDHMIYVADGPSDVPVFSVVRGHGGKAYAVYASGNKAEFAQNDALLQSGRINAYGPADYRIESTTATWLKMHVELLCEQIVREHENAIESRTSRPPRHLHREDQKGSFSDKQKSFF